MPVEKPLKPGEKSGQTVAVATPWVIGALSFFSALSVLAAALSVIFGSGLVPTHGASSASPGLTLAHTVRAKGAHSVTTAAPTSKTLAKPKRVVKAAPARLSPHPQSSLQSAAIEAPVQILEPTRPASSEADRAARLIAKQKLAAKLTQLAFARKMPEAPAPAEQFASTDADETQGQATSDPAASVAAARTTLAALPENAALQAAKDVSLPVPANDLASEATPVQTQTSEIVLAVVPAPVAKPVLPRRPVTPETQQTQSRTSPPVLAYATPGEPDAAKNSLFGGLGKVFKGTDGGLPGRGSKVAVYDISAAIVHMPDGTKLEAHSGIGHRKDNPKYSHVRNLGPTPPNIYDLRMRERRFHGVEAIRMLPRDIKAMKGRDGMLAHSPLLRRTNGSHGCVAFKHYDKFLKAFKAGKVKQIIVVPSMDKLPTYMAKLNRNTGA